MELASVVLQYRFNGVITSLGLFSLISFIDLENGLSMHIDPLNSGIKVLSSTSCHNFIFDSHLAEEIANEPIFTHFRGYSLTTSTYRTILSFHRQVTLILLTHRELSNLKVSLYPLIQSNRVGFITLIPKIGFEPMTFCV